MLRSYSNDEYDGFSEAGYSRENIHRLLGDHTFDIYLNESVYWKNIPSKVWEYFIGGYQVIKKWLSYREQDIIGRPLNRDEAREVSGIARRITALLLMQDELNANYQRIKNNYVML